MYVEGRLKSRTYQTQSGETRFSNDINVTEIQFLGQKGERSDQAFVAEQFQQVGEDPDLPF